MDFPGADEIAARLSKTLPPNLLAPDMKDVSPQIQAILQAQDAQVKDLGQKLQAAMIALNDKSADRAIEMEKIGRDFEAKLLKIVSDTETKVALIQEKADASYNAHIGSQIKQLGLDVAELIHGMPSGQAVVGGEQPGAQQQPVENDVLPPQAAQSLKEGRVTTFKNGSKWTMKDGNPVRVA